MGPPLGLPPAPLRVGLPSSPAALGVGDTGQRDLYTTDLRQEGCGREPRGVGANRDAPR